MKKLVGLFLVSAISLSFCLLGLEVALAAYQALKNKVNPYAKTTVDAYRAELRSVAELLNDQGHRQPALVIHPYLGYIVNDDQRQRHHGMPNNRSGFYAEVEATYQPADTNEFVVAVLGGSVAAQLCIIGEKALKEELAQVPGVQGRPVVIVPLAQGGYKQPQHLISFAYHYVLGLRPDLVINIDGVNQMLFFQNNTLNNHIDPSYPWNWLTLVTTDQHPEVMRERLAIMNERELRSARALRMLERGRYRSVLARSLRRRMDMMSLARERQAEEAMVDHLTSQDVGERTFQQTGPVYWKADSLDAALAKSATLWRDSSILLSDMVKGRGIPYLHGLQPNQYFPGTRTLTDWEKQHAYNTNSTFYLPLSRGYAFFTNEMPALLEARVPFVNLSQWMADPPETIYSDDFSHFNEHGNRLLARAVAEAVASIMPKPATD